MAGYDGWRRGRPGYDFGWRNDPYPLRPPPQDPSHGYRQPGGYRMERPGYAGGYRMERPGYAGGYVPDRSMIDEAIRMAVRSSLFEDTWLDARGVDIEVENGVVTLRGEVRSQLEARYAWDDAWETEGVRGVISRIEVRDPAAGARDAGEG